MIPFQSPSAPMALATLLTSAAATSDTTLPLPTNSSHKPTTCDNRRGVT